MTDVSKLMPSSLDQAQIQMEINQNIENHIENTLELIKKANESKEINMPISEMFERLDSPAIIDMKDEYSSLMFDNPLENGDYITTNRETLYTAHDVAIRTKDNFLLAETLNKGEFDLENPKIEIANTIESNLFFEDNSKFKSISLGNAMVLPNNGILIDDIDVENIPKNLNIHLFKEEKEFIVVGKEFGIDDAENSEKVFEKIDQEIFIESTLKDAQREELNPIERMFLALDPIKFLKIFIKYLPVSVFLYYLSMTQGELEQVETEIHMIDERRMQALIKMKKQFV